ncbi:MAG TPA: glycoside hydrolase family 2 TIM barrel-domain containing protein [Gemmatimonadaceae bacterium]|nr:glycoside hydrolase family 2 TIM barrel-domain containing protein [Gemmatimonadaceae bacterium]
MFCVNVLAAAILLAAATAAPGQTVVRTDTNIDAGWLYLERPLATAADLDTVAPSAWQHISLPHTWNRFDPVDPVPGYRRDASWYRRTLDLRHAPANARYLLHFEDANTVADIYVNGRRAGGHVGGYVGFDVDITPFVRRDGRDRIDVRVDNTDDPDLIPSDKSDFIIYGGLTRDVWLSIRPNVSIAHVGITTPAVSRDSATTTVVTDLANPRHEHGTGTLVVSLVDPHGRVVARDSGHVALDAGAPDTLRLPTIRNPSLWSPASPSLYHVDVSLRRNGAELDRTRETIGYRFFTFASNGPFYLNGERLLIRGTHIHEEAAGYGAAMPNAMYRHDMELIKSMGANFVRLAHYPHDPEFYRAADSLGLMLWDELPWDRAGLGGARWQATTRRLLVEQIRQNENHPSIIMWSLGNEVGDVIDPANSGDKQAIAAFMSQLDTIAHTLDPYRPTATRKFDPGAAVVDVYSPSIWVGWYSAVYEDYEKALASVHAKFPRMFHAEYGADALYGRHTEHPITGKGLQIDTGFAEQVGKKVANIARQGDWSESYQTDLMEWHLQVAERTPWLTGNAQWAFRDFATPLRPDNPIPYVNQKGLFTRDGTPKDAYYLYKAYWTDSPKFVYIVSHTWTERAGPPGVAREVRVFSNCAKVDLSLNGTSQGERTRDRTSFPAQGLRWDVLFADGANHLEARCAGEDAPMRDTLTVHYTHAQAGKADHIAMRSRLLSSGHVLVEATIVDAKGQRVLSASDRVYFGLNGDGRLLADLGTPTGSSIIEAANGRAAIEVEVPRGGHATIIARTQDINGSRLTVDAGGHSVSIP